VVTLLFMEKSSFKGEADVVFIGAVSFA
jgi:hypothetical protein